jgi:hypothetical protein
MKKNKVFVLGMLAALLAFGLVLPGCDNTTNSDDKVLAITKIPAELASQEESGIQIGIFPVETTPQQALAQTGLVAGAGGAENTVTLSGTTIIASFYASDGTKWTDTNSDTGTYAVYLQAGSSFYQAPNVSFYSGSALVPFSTFAAEKFLAITDIPEDGIGSGTPQIGIFPVGTTWETAQAQTGFVAGAGAVQLSVSGTDAIVLLYADGKTWTGTGTYDVYLKVGDGAYRVQNVSFSSGSASISAKKFERPE